MIIFLSISLNMCSGSSKEQSHRDGYFKYPQYIFWLREKIQLRTLIWGPGMKKLVIWVALVCSVLNYL